MVLPNTVLIGPGRTGTTSIFRVLCTHPEICGSKQKEADRYRAVIFKRALLPIELYAQQFSHYSSEQIILEATPGYFFGGRDVAKVMRRELNGLRVIVTLRNPVERLYSLYKHVKSKLDFESEDSFEQYVRKCLGFKISDSLDEIAIQYAGFWEGVYIKWLREWIEELGSENVYVMFYEDWESFPQQSLCELVVWLGIDAQPLEAIEFPHDNKSLGYRSLAFQKAALRMNVCLESVFRRHPSVKKTARNIYYYLNGKHYHSDILPSLRNKLTAVYLEPNAELKKYLVNLGHKSFPDWL